MRFFRRSKPAAESDAAPHDEPTTDDALDAALDEESDDTDLVIGTEGDVYDASHEAQEWRERADAVIPGGASTGSKRASALFGESERDDLPAMHYVRAAGCELVTVAGDTLVDCTMALGAVALGYADPLVTQRVIEVAAAGNVSGLSSVLEVEVAERLCDVVPCAEQVRFLKSGAEACAAAVRIARAATGRSRVVGCGYFGWLDWWSKDTAGVPAGAHADFTPVPFDDVPALEAAVKAAGRDLAAVMIEPFVEREPSKEWLAAARVLCDDYGAVLIFDELKTGFRVRTGGWQEYAGVEPDLATFGKALANGYPLAAVVGHAAVMDAARNTWISSTLASESTALAAALAVLDWHEEADVCATLAETGREIRATFERAIAASGVDGVTTDGIDPMFLCRWDDRSREARFLAECARAGVLVKRGAHNFAAVAHDEEAIQEIEAAVSGALVALADWERAR